MRKINQIAEELKKVFPSICLSNLQIDRLELYLRLLEQWNQTYNLTAVKGTQNLIAKHLSDSLVPLGLAQQIKTALVGKGLDLGSGAGIPGLILALCLDKVEIISLDAVQKKITFQEVVKASVKLGNFTAVHSRFEQFAQTCPDVGMFDFIVARALSSLSDLARWARLFLRSGGNLWAWKGQGWEAEWSVLLQEGDFQFVESHPYHLSQGYGGVLLILRYQG